MEPSKHLVLIFPQDSSKEALRPLATALVSSLTDACGQMPVFVRPDATALCVLCSGDFKAITAAVDAVTDAYTKWLVLTVAAPFEAHGLSTALQWLSRAR